MRTSIIVIILSMTVLFSFSQSIKIDSLKVVLKSNITGSEKLTVYKSLCKQLNRFASPIESIPIYKSALKLSDSLKDYNFNSRIYRYLHVSYKHMDSLDFALKYLNEAIFIDKENNNSKGLLLDINLLGAFYIDTQDYTNAIITFQKGIDNYNPIDSLKTICTIYTNLGIAYYEINETVKSVQSLLNAVDYAELYNTYEEKNFALHHIGVAYMSDGQYQKAESYFLKSLSDTIHNKFPSWRNANHHALAYNYWLMGEYEKSIKHGKISEEFNKSIGNIFHQFEDIRYQVQAHNYLGQYKDAIEAGNRALELSSNLQFIDVVYALKVNLSTSYLFTGQFSQAENLLIEVLNYINEKPDYRRINSQRLYKNLSILYEKQKEYEKSLLYFKKYQKKNEAELIKQKESKVSEIEQKYQSEKKESEIETLKTGKRLQHLELRRKQEYLTFSIILAALIILLAYLIVKRLRLKLSKSKVEAELKSKLFRTNTTTVDQLNKQNRAYKKLVKYLNDLKPFVSIEKRKEIQEKANYFKKQSFDLPWLIFYDNFTIAFPDFIEKLYDEAPNLTKSEIKLASLIKSQMHTNEMKIVLNTSNSNINTTKSRLREKITQITSVKMEEYLQNL